MENSVGLGKHPLKLRRLTCIENDGIFSCVSDYFVSVKRYILGSLVILTLSVLQDVTNVIKKKVKVKGLGRNSSYLAGFSIFFIAL